MTHKIKKTQTKSTVAANTDKVVLKTGGSSAMLMSEMSAGGELGPTADDISNVHSGGAASSQSGAFEYLYPIEVPPGRNGLTPEVSLNYSSNITELISPFGYGWSTNIPKIERLNLTGTNKLYTENNFTSSLDGQLVGLSSSTYRAKVESGSFNTYSYIDGVWTVYDKAGTRYTFGSTTASRQDNASNTNHVAVWMLDEVIDKNGEKIAYTYFKNNGQIYPDVISYAYNAGTPIYTVKFLRALLSATTSPNFVHSQFTKGFEEKTNYITSAVQVFTNNVKTLQVSFGYVYESWSSNLLCSELTKTGYDENGATTTLPKTTFTYKLDPSYSFTTSNTWASTTPSDLFTMFTGPTTSSSSVQITESYYRTKIMDVNGDNLADWVANGDVYMNTGAGWAATSTWTGLPASFDGAYRLVDINGDGLPDRIKAKDYVFHPSLGLTNYKEVEFLFNQGDGTWTTNSAWSTTTPLLFYTETTSATGSMQSTTYRNYFADMNGDGLADWIYAGNVYMNTGTGWTATATWTGLPNNFESIDRLEDVNGDGLPDIVRAYKKTFDPAYSSDPTITDYSVKLNRGDGTWQTDANWTATIPGPIYMEHQISPTVIQSTSTNVYLTDLNGDSLPEWLMGEKIYKNVGIGWSVASNTVNVKTDNFSKDVRLTDINGDGLSDYVVSWTKSWDSSYGLPDQVFRTVFLNNAKKLWLMATTTNELGGTTGISYTPSAFPKNGVIQNPNSPYTLYTVTALTTDPKIGSKETTTYEYTGGDLYHDPADVFSRTYAGFHTVTQISSLGKITNYYHQGNGATSTSQETPDDYAKIGLAYRNEVTDLSGNLYKLKINRYATSSPSSGASYVKLDRETDLNYDGDSDHRDTAAEYTYNSSNGTLSTKTDWGRVTASTDGTFDDVSGDKRTSTYSYAENTGINISAILAGEAIKNEASATTSDIRYYYDSQALGSVLKGNLTKTESWASSSTYINTQSAYNSFGLKTSDTDPLGHTTSYGYDTYNLYPASTTNALSQSMFFTYDYSSGKPKTITDSNNLTKSLVYDGQDRILEVKVPDPSTGATTTETKYVYSDVTSSTSVKISNYLSSTTIQDTYSYLDGFGREIQTRISAEAGNQYSVLDKLYAENGLLKKQSLPYFSSGSSRTTSTTTSDLYTSYTYDALSRAISAGNTVGTTTNSYDQWIETVTDALGSDKDYTYDAFGNLSKVTEHNGTSTYHTEYEWDNNGNLTKITDALGNIRNVTYDGLSRRLSLEDLHDSADTTFGAWAFAYDNSGNLTTKTDPKSQVINYTYDDINRPLTEDYTGQAGAEVTYIYDSCTRGVGSLCAAKNTSATTTYSYNYAGLPAIEAKTIGTTTYSTSYAYDRMGNQTLITYPDNSEVRYTFNTANLLERVEQKESGGSWQDVITDFDYAPTGQITYQEHANGTKTTKTYAPEELYRLRSIVTTASSTYGTGGAGGELAQAEAELFINGHLTEESTTTDTDELDSTLLPTASSTEDVSVGDVSGEEIATTTETAINNLIDTATSSATSTTESLLEDDTASTATTTEIENNEVLLATSSSTLIFGIASSTALFDIPLEDALSMTTATTTVVATSTPGVLSKEELASTDRLVTNAHEARVWQRFHAERLKALETNPEAPQKTVEAARYAKDRFDNYLLQKGYSKTKGGKIESQATEVIKDKFRKGLEVVASALLPDKAYAYLFGIEDFENCSSLPCSFNNTSVWGSVTGSLDHTSKVEGEDSFKTVVGGEGIATLESVNYNEDEVWVQFKIFIPSGMTWGASGYFNTLLLEDSGNGLVFGLTIEDWGAPRLTMMGDPLGWTDTGIDLTAGAVNTIEVRFKKGTTNGDVDIWHNNSNGASPDYNGSGTMNTGTDNVDDVKVGVAYSPESDVSDLYFDDFGVDLGFIGSLTTPPSEPFDAILQDATYTYDAVGNITSMVDEAATSIVTYGYEYDDLYRLANFGTTTATSTINPLETFTYDALGNILTKSTTGSYSYQGSDNGVNTYHIYNDSLGAGISDWSWNVINDPNNTSPVQSGSNSLEVTYTNPWGGVSYNIPSINLANYDDLNLAVNVPNPTNLDLYLYFYDHESNVLDIVDVEDYITGDFATSTWHDISVPLGDLGLTNYNETLTFTIEASASTTVYYDNIRFVGTNGPANYANPHAATTVNGTTHTYDQNGNLTAVGSATHTWTYNNYLSVSHEAATTTYAYDHQGQRVQKTTGSLNTIYPSNLYEVNGTNTEKHIYGNGLLLATIKSDTPAPKLYHNHLDHLDSTKAVTTPDGYLNQELEYYPFGETRVDEQYGELTQSNQYIGQNFDHETALSYLNARYYDGERGQMLSQDPVFLGVGVDERSALILKDPQLQNSYGYGRNNPLIYKDPNGELAIPIIGAGVGFIGGLASQAYSDYENGSMSGVGDYAMAGGQGFVVGLGVGGLGRYGSSFIASALTAGTLTAGTELGTNYLQGESTDYHDLATKSLLAAGTAGTLSKLSKVRGTNPNIGTKAFFTGKHTQRQGAEEAVHVSAQSLGSSARAYSGGGSSKSSSNKISSNQYKNISTQLLKAQSALSKKDYNGATKALERASKTLNKK